MSEVLVAPQSMRELERFEKTAGMLSWLASCGHKQIGILYLLTALGFFVIGGCEALLMRLQLAVANNQLLKPDKAFDWIGRYGDETGDGYLQYSARSNKGLGNQGWKDSGDSIVNADGTLAEPPIALVEVQGYVYLAKVSVAELYDRAGDRDTAQRLRAEADQLRNRFERDLWLEDKGIYAMACRPGRNQRP